MNSYVSPVTHPLYILAIGWPEALGMFHSIASTICYTKLPNTGLGGNIRTIASTWEGLPYDIPN